MKRLAILLSLLLGAIATLWAQGDPYAKVHEGDRLPDFEVAMSDGTTLRSADLEGKVVWICLWASWCPSCRKEFRWLAKDADFAELLQSEEFVFLPIAREENSATVGEWFGKMGYPYISGTDPERKVYELFAEQEIPRNIIVGRDGVIVLHSSACSRKTIVGVVAKAKEMLN